MRIAYLLAEDLSKHPGLKHKIDGQIHRWQKQGHDVFRIEHFRGVSLKPDGSEMLSRRIVEISQTNKLGLLKRLSAQYKFAANALQQIQPDITYSRYLFPARHISLINKFSGKLIMEVNSDDRAEYLQKSRVTGLYNALFRRYSLNKASGFIFVTKELANAVAFNSFSANRTVIANGVDTADFSFEADPKNERPQLVLIGSPGQAWHGLDKIKILSESLPGCSFHIIGPDELSVERLWGSMPINVRVHGYLSNSDAQQLIRNMDIGIGTLALHRNRMHEACPLKVRQYLAHGLPVIAASSDTDVPEYQPFYLELPNAENNILSNIDVIKQFISSVHGNIALRNQARRYAELVLSADKKEADRLRFFEQVLAS